jgi:hypothetical protein
MPAPREYQMREGCQAGSVQMPTQMTVNEIASSRAISAQPARFGPRVSDTSS